MGEMADFYIAQMQDAYGWSPVGSRKASRPSAYRPSAPKSVTCRHCGAQGLWWFPTKRDSYFLKNADGTQHNCLRVPASPDELADCTPQAADFSDLA